MDISIHLHRTGPGGIVFFKSPCKTVCALIFIVIVPGLVPHTAWSAYVDGGVYLTDIHAQGACVNAFNNFGGANPPSEAWGDCRKITTAVPGHCMSESARSFTFQDFNDNTHLFEFCCGTGNTPCCPSGHTLSAEGQCLPHDELIPAKNLGPQCTSAGESSAPSMAGNPVSVTTGNKFQHETDYVSAFGKLEFSRYYNSSSELDIGLGTGWSGSYLQYVSFHSASHIALHEKTGRQEVFTCPDMAGECTGDPDTRVRVVKDAAGYSVYRPDDSREFYDLSGKLLTILYPNAYSIVLAYNAQQQLATVTDSVGYQLQMSYWNGRLEAVTDASGDQRMWKYRYDVNNNLEYVDHPDGTTRQYHYEDTERPAALTGVTDERGIRYATFEYDASGRAQASYHGPQTSVLTERIEGVSIVYNPDGTRIVTNSNGNASSYTISVQYGLGMVTDISGPGCVSCGTGNTSYSHDPDNSNLLSKTGNGVTTLYGNYDPDGNPAFMIEAAGTDEERRTDYSYDPRYHGKVASLTTASVVTGSKKVTNYGYDDFGNRTSVTIDGFDPDGNPVTQTTTYQYNGPLFQLSRVDGPRDNLADVTDITTLRYYTNDPLEGYNRARLKEVEGANGVLLRSNIQYTATGKVSAETRPNGLLMTYSYYPGNDRLEMLAETSPSASRVTRWTYLESGEVASITHGYGAPESTTLTFGYDDARRLISVTDGLGNTIEYVLDTEGNRLEENIRNSGGFITRQMRQTYDLYNRIDAAAQANETVQYDYSPEGALSRSVDGKGGVKGFSYDSLMRLSASTQDLGNLNIMTQYSYDAVDRLSTVIDPAGGVTRYVYDDLGNLLSLISPDTGVTTFRYDPAGNLIQKIDAKGQTFIFTYDAINRLVAIDAPGTSDDISYSYDSCTNGAGRLCAVTRDNNMLHYRYTAYGEVASIEQSVTTWSGIQQAHGTLSYSYDATGRLATITYPGGASITYQYDAAGQLGIVNLKVADKQKTLLSNATYLPFGPSANQLLGNGLTVGGWYDQAYRPWVIGGGTFYDALYYDENGNAYTRYMPAGVSNYGYDALNRLGEAVLPVGERSYSYDSNGNRIQLTSDGVTTKYSYTTNSNRLSAIDASVVELDSNGNATNLGGMALDYTTDNRIKSVMRVADYSYNGIGQRIQKSVRASDAAGDYGFGPKRVFLYGKNGELIAESGPGGVVTREYIYVNEQLFALIDHVPDSGEIFLNGDMDRDGSITVEDFIEWYFNHYQNGIDVSYEVTGDAVMDQADIDAMLACAINGNCIAASFDTRLYYVHNDHLGTPHALTDETGVKIWSATYDPFGKAIADGDPDGDGTTFTMNIRFPGQYYDQETGLHYNYFRYYDPETGRYLTADPIGQIPPPGTTPYKLNHLYTYVGNNPLNRIDPLGLFEYYGNWCGPNHTGGFDKPWDQLTSQEQQNALLPKDDLDSCCQIHDLCHADCRANHPCSETDRQDCLNRCDRGLANCAVGCQSGGNRRWMLERYMRGSNSGAGPNTPNCRMTGP